MRESDEARDKKGSGYNGPGHKGGDSVPVPDPTTLTTAQLYREIAALSEIFEAKMGALTTRLTTSENGSKESLANAAQTIQNGLDKAEKSIVVSIEKVQNEQRIALTDAEKRVNEKFEMMDKQRIESKADFNLAIAAALMAQKELFAQQTKCNEEAATKSENATSKQLESVKSEAALSRQSLDEKITALKERIDRGGGREDQWSEQRTHRRESVSWVIPMLFVAAGGAVGWIIALIPHVAK
jgi:hypothetical protein